MSYELYQRSIIDRFPKSIAFHFVPNAHREDEVFCGDFPRLYQEENAWILIGSLDKADPNWIQFFIQKYSNIPVEMRLTADVRAKLDDILSSGFEIAFGQGDNPFGRELEIIFKPKPE